MGAPGWTEAERQLRLRLCALMREYPQVSSVEAALDLPLADVHLMLAHHQTSRIAGLEGEIEAYVAASARRREVEEATHQ